MGEDYPVLTPPRFDRKSWRHPTPTCRTTPRTAPRGRTRSRSLTGIISGVFIEIDREHFCQCLSEVLSVKLFFI